MRALRIILWLTFLSTLFAVAQEPATNQPADKSDTKATVYVYRYKQFAGSAITPSVYLDEMQLARMENGRYFTVRMDPGKHIFRSEDKQAGVEIDLKAGEQYFIRVEIATGLMKGHGRLLLIAPEQGGYEMRSSKLRPLDSSKVVDASLVSVEEARLHTDPK
jgi:hypothetical protein